MRFRFFSVVSVAAASLALTIDALQLSSSGSNQDYDASPEVYDFAEVDTEVESTSESEKYMNGRHRIANLKEVIARAQSNLHEANLAIEDLQIR